MVSSALLPDPSALRFECVSFTQDQVVLVVSSSRPTGICPDCGLSGSRIHSGYIRTLEDLPWLGRRVVTELKSRHTQSEIMTHLLAPATAARTPHFDQHQLRHLA